MTPYFTKEFRIFFADLQKHNTREWFHSEKERYEIVVKKPFNHFIEDLITEISKLDPEVHIDGSEAIFRLNRDIRFAKDKTPYKTHMSAIISATGRKDRSIPGMYIRLSDKELFFYGGLYKPSQKQLLGIRNAITKNQRLFKKLVDNHTFRHYFGALEKGERYIRLPAEYSDVLHTIPEIANKSFMYGAELDVKLIFTPKLLSTVMSYWKAAQPVKDFLRNATK